MSIKQNDKHYYNYEIGCNNIKFINSILNTLKKDVIYKNESLYIHASRVSNITTIDVTELMKLFFDIEAQLDYLRNNGYIFSHIVPSNIYNVDGKYVILTERNLCRISTGNNIVVYKPLVKNKYMYLKLYRAKTLPLLIPVVAPYYSLVSIILNMLLNIDTSNKSSEDIIEMMNPIVNLSIYDCLIEYISL